MAKIRDLKKVINYELSDVIEECYVWQIVNPDTADKAEDVIDEAISSFDTFMVRVNEDNIQDKKAHFRGIKSDLTKVKTDLLGKLSKL